MKWRETSNRTCSRPFNSFVSFSSLFLMGELKKQRELTALLPKKTNEKLKVLVLFSRRASSAIQPTTNPNQFNQSIKEN
eukprot:UN02370